MSMIVNVADQRDSDNEGDKYSNAEKSREGSPDQAAASNPQPPEKAKPKVRFELSCYESTNALLHTLFTQGKYDECKIMIADTLERYGGRCEYCLYIAGLISRIEGELETALDWFEKALQLSGNDPQYLKEIGRIYFLMGKHTLAVENLEKAVKGNPKDSSAYFWLAKSISKLDTDLFNPLEKARDLLCQAPVLVYHAQLVEFLGELQSKLGDYNTAIQAYTRALELEPENESIMFRLGMLHLKHNAEDPAFAVFGKALTYNPTNPDCILAIGSIMQKHGDHDVALNKYRVAAQNCDYNGFLWNNIAVCLYSKGKLAAAHSCLKKAAYLSPLNHKINYNLGIVHLAMDLNASAHHFLKAAIDLKKDDAQIIGAYAVVLGNMKDNRNARRAYIRSLNIKSSPQTLLNFAIFAHENDEDDVAMTMTKKLREELAEISNNDDLLRQAERLEEAILTASDRKAKKEEREN